MATWPKSKRQPKKWQRASDRGDGRNWHERWEGAVAWIIYGLFWFLMGMVASGGCQAYVSWRDGLL